MKKQKRTKSERIALLTLKKTKVETTLNKTTKEVQRLKNRIVKRELEGLSIKFLQKILAEKNRATRSIRNKLKSINEELSILTKSPGIIGLFSNYFFIENHKENYNIKTTFYNLKLAMTDLTVDYVLDKYGEIIKEEINMKDISPMGNAGNIKKIFKPIGSQISAKFGKDTGNVIKFGKMGNIKEGENGDMIVFDDSGNEWILAREDYEIAYEGLDGNDVAADGDIIARLDLEISPELEKEGVAREISRFLNQMRKDADYNIDARVNMYYETENEYAKDVINSFSEFLSHEALLSSVNSGKQDGDIQAVFNLDEMTVTFTLKK